MSSTPSRTPASADDLRQWPTTAGALLISSASTPATRRWPTGAPSIAARCRSSTRLQPRARRAPTRGSHRRQGRAGLRHQHRLRQTRQRAHRRPPIWRHCRRNIVLSHAAGVGEPMPVAIVRLMMALKLASLAQGASGVQPKTLALLEAMLADDVIPVVPAQGSVGASGDLAPLSHMTAAMIGVGDCFTPHGRFPAKVAFVSHGLEPVTLGAEGRAGAAQRHPVLHGLCAGRAVRGGSALSVGAGHRRAIDRCRQGLGCAVRSAHPCAAEASRPDRDGGCAAQADGRQRHPRLASRRRRARAGPVLPALPAAGDGRGPRRAAPGGGDARRPRPTASPTIR